MQKPQPSNRKGLAVNITKIVPQVTASNQVLQLTSYVIWRQLTSALELLESRGYCDKVTTSTQMEVAL